MENRNDILNELKELSPMLAGMDKLNLYSVPAGYFDGISDHVLTLVTAQNSQLIQNISTRESMKVPEGYFDALADNILAKIKIHDEALTASAEIRALSPMLYSIQGENPFTVPRGYFEGLSESVLENVQPQKSRVVPMRRWGNLIMKYAAAAVFTGMMALAVFNYDKPEQITPDPAIAAGMQIAKENSFDAELAKLNDADIINYLENNGTDADVALVANSIDEKELPAREDYILDDKTLDNYLNNINLSDLEN